MTRALGIALAVACSCGFAAAGEPARTDVVGNTKACEAKDVRACTALGYLHLTGQGVATDELRAVELFSRACDGGDAGGCAVLGALYSQGRGKLAADPARSFVASKRGCALGDGLACFDTASDLATGRGVAKDAPQASGLFAKLCKSGLGKACTALGTLVLVGDGVPKDEKAAIELFNVGCKSGDPKGCDFLKPPSPSGGVGRPKKP